MYWSLPIISLFATAVYPACKCTSLWLRLNKSATYTLLVRRCKLYANAGQSDNLRLARFQKELYGLLLEPLIACVRPARWRHCQTNSSSQYTALCQVYIDSRPVAQLQNSSQQLPLRQNRTISRLQLKHGFITAVLAVSIYNCSNIMFRL